MRSCNTYSSLFPLIHRSPATILDDRRNLLSMDSANRQMNAAAPSIAVDVIVTSFADAVDDVVVEWIETPQIPF